MMKYWVIGILQNNTKWYLATKENKTVGKMYRFVLGVDIAVKFSSEEEAKQILMANIKGKKVSGVFTSEFKVQTFEASA